MARDRFQFLKSFADSLRELAKADEWLAKDVAWEIINYWIYGEEMNSENSIVNAIFLQMKLVIDKGHAISDANSINWKKGWRPIKDWENSQKANWNPNESETKTKKSKKENIKYKNKNIKDKKENNNKNLYLDFVYLTGEEYSKLEEKLWSKLTNELIEKLNNYIGSSGKKYKSHYYTILNWSKNEKVSNSDYERERKMELHKQKILKQYESFNSDTNWDESYRNQTGWYNRRNDIWFDEVSW